MAAKTLFYGGQPGGTYGWGVCNRYLLEELAKRTEVVALTEAHPQWAAQALPGNFFTPLGNHELAPLAPARGERNLGYGFFELEPNALSAENAKRLEVVFVGSRWAAERLRARGITNSAVLVQGVDARVFSPGAGARDDGEFRIFSGGKFEMRKGQDLVLRAFRVLQQKYPDMRLVNAWYNHWPQVMALMARSRHIKFELIEGTWTERMEHIYRLNGIDPARVTTLPLLPQAEMAEIYRGCDVGVFPNRCEGGTNLVLMEFMACGQPAVVTDGTGHGDVVNGKNALRLRQLRELNIKGPDGEMAARWVEPAVEEIIAQVEFAYKNRAAAAAVGRQGAADMAAWTWGRAAETILAHVG